jgi:hypothetical protein
MRKLHFHPSLTSPPLLFCLQLALATLPLEHLSHLFRSYAFSPTSPTETPAGAAGIRQGRRRPAPRGPNCGLPNLSSEILVNEGPVRESGKSVRGLVVKADLK